MGCNEARDPLDGGPLARSGVRNSTKPTSMYWPPLRLTCGRIQSQSSERQLLVAGENQLGESFRIDEFSILALQVGVGDPTGLGATPSDKNPNLVLDGKLQQLFQRRHTDALQRVCDRSPQHDWRVNCEIDFHIVASLLGALRNMERHTGTCGVLG